MKITLNLSPAPSARDRFALVWAIPATIIGFAVLFFLGRATFQEYRDYRVIRDQLAEVEKRTAELHNEEAALRRKFDDPTNRDLLHRARFVNNLIEQRELSLTELSTRLAGLMPQDAHLTGLALTSPKRPGENYMVRMGITARNEDAVETFINDLEDAPDFKDVSIVNQGFQEQSAQPDQVNVVCMARYLPGTDINAETPSAEEPKTNSQ
jgi:cell division protein FtsB